MYVHLYTSGIYMVIDNGPLHPLHMCCQFAFCSIGRTAIGRLGALKGSQMPDAATLLTALVKVTIDILDCDKDTVLMHVGKRVPHTKTEHHFGELLTSIDCAIEVIDTHDRQASKDNHHKAVTSSESLDGFMLEFQS